MGKKQKKEKMEEIAEECTCGEETCSCGDDCDCHGGCGCGCESDHSHFVRQYYTKAEKIAMLEEYLSELKAEAAGVEEELAELRK